MYCGDETGAFIGDVGSHSSRFGYGGEDNPKYVVPSYVSILEGDAGRPGNRIIPTSSYQLRAPETKSIYRMAQLKMDSPMEPQVDPNAYLQQGDLVDDWDAYQHVWQTSLDVMRVRDTLKHTRGGGDYQTTVLDGSTTNTTSAARIASTTLRSKSHVGEGKCLHPLLVVDSGCTHSVNTQYDAAVHRAQRIQMTEIMMEAMDASAMFIAPTPMLAAFSHGRQTCMLVDVGASGCRVTPVVDGLLLKHAQRRNGRGGDWLGNVQWQALVQENVPVKPRYQLRSNAVTPVAATPVFHRWAMQDLMYEFRTSEHVTMPIYRMDDTTPFVYSDKDNNGDAMQVDPVSTYELPDGTHVDLTTRIGKDLCRVPELLFTDHVPFQIDETLSSPLLQHPTLSHLPLHKLIHDSLGAVGDADARKELCGNIVLTGGSSLLPHMEQRLSYELTTVVPSYYKCKVIASRNSTERSCAAWIGGSVLTSLGSFQQLWLSRTEYEEYGTALAIQRFP